MKDFRSQIVEDIKEYQREMPEISNIAKDEWAFNYWVLDKLFFEDQELIEEKIIDYHDMGIDAFEIYEDTKEVFLIQNKYYSDTTSITADYVKNDFLLRGITALENGTYPRSGELQAFFTKYKNHPDFTVHLQLFVTNNNRVAEADKYISEFNTSHPKYIATIYYLDDIQEKYYGEIEENRSSITIKIESVNKGTILNINSDSYHLENIVDARYVFTPVTSVYRFYRDAIEKGYPIFDRNIREYLGNKGVNKSIYQTLLDPEERKNFFYYNNGITVICDKMYKIEQQHADSRMNAVFQVENPQIVNGCQTVNSIFEALRNIDPAKLENEFKDSFVMLKILEIDKNDKKDQDLYHNIVKYNNSQNAIDEKTFAANTSEFRRLQTEFKKKGFLLLIKQSDKNTFSTEYKTPTELRKANSDRLKRFGLSSLTKVSDFYIPIDKLLQIINAFERGGEVAYTNKSNVLKFNSTEYNTGISFIKSVTTDALLDLFLLYVRAEKEKKNSTEKRTPIPYYLIDGFALYECTGRNKELICGALKDEAAINKIIRLYSLVTKAYTKAYCKTNAVEYNKMIKQAIDYDLLDTQRDIYIDT